MILQRIVLASAAGLASALLLGACGSSNDTASGTNPSSAAPVATAASDPANPAAPKSPAPAASAPAAGGNSGKTGHMATTSSVAARAVKGVGSVVTDDKGMTLYRYGRDQASPSKWTCADACTRTWVPVIVGDSVRTSGVDKGLLGTVHRNGMKQLTLAGWPLYRYKGDTQADQVNGQGRDKEWYAVTPSGQKSVGSPA